MKLEVKLGQSEFKAETDPNDQTEIAIISTQLQQFYQAAEKQPQQQPPSQPPPPPSQPPQLPPHQ